MSVVFPSDYVGNATLFVSVWSTESFNGTISAEVSRTLNFTILDAAASAPLLFNYPAQGEQDAFIPLVVFAAPTDADSETLSIRISNVPAGATLSAGTADGPGAFLLTPAQLFGLTVQPPFVFAGTFTLGLEARSVEMNGGDVATTTQDLVVTVLDRVATPPGLTVQPASGNQNSAIPLAISAALVDADGSESLSIRVSGVPAGATLSVGTPDGSGAFLLTPLQLTGLTLMPPPSFAGPLNLTVTAIARETANGQTASTPTTLAVTVVDPTASPPLLTVQAASGEQGSAIPISISATPTDGDGSETVSVRLSGLPTGATLSVGISDGLGNFVLTASQLIGLTLKLPVAGSFNFTVTATTTESSNGQTASLQR
ncbi:MAG: hypothetical protein ACRDD1_19765, partial [Planctomycetia bacterium]